MSDKGYSIATAYIQLMPSADGFGDEVKRQAGVDLEDVGESSGGTFSTGLKKGLAIAGTVLVAATGAAVELTKQVADSYGEYEQLVGGINKLFGDMDYQAVVDNASQAFKTAGLSANDYMETVTSFSASLIKGLDGDTQAAVAYADMAITDMSDNANTFGTDMASIQNAYQGFAKQNFTMLDNLKLGYAGTKEGMQQLIDDANNVKLANGEMADLSIDSFADMVEAIHIMQTEMNVAGTTAKEAEGTIEGSANAMKAAWENLLTGLGDSDADIQTLTKNFTDSFETYINNLEPVIQNVSEALPEVLGSVLDVAAELLPDLIVELVPSAVSGLTRLAAGLLTHIPDIIGGVVVGLVDGIAQAITGEKTGWFDFIEGYEESLDEVAGYISSLNTEIDNTAAAYASSVTASEADAAAAMYLKDRIFELVEEEEKSAGQKALLKTLIDELNTLVPDLALSYDEETNSLSLQNDEITKNIELVKEQAQVNALEQLYTESLKEQYEAQKALADSRSIMNGILSEYGITLADVESAEDSLATQTLGGMIQAADTLGISVFDLYSFFKTWEAATGDVDLAEQMLEETTGRVKFAEEELGIAMVAMTDTSVASIDTLSVEWQHVFGEEMPAALTDAVTASADAGVNIPAELAAGIIGGYMDVDAAMLDLNALIEFQDAVDAAITAGADIPAEEAAQLYASMPDVETAVAALNALVIFNDAIEEAKSGGINIDAGLVEGLESSTGLAEIESAASEAGQAAIDALKAGAGVESPSWKADEAGQYVLSGLYNGLNNGSYHSSIFSTMWDLGASIISKVKSAMGVSSPSKYAREIGQFFDEGLFLGLTDGTEDVLQAADEMASGVVDTTNDMLDEMNRSVLDSALSGTVDITKNIRGGLSDATLRSQVEISGDAQNNMLSQMVYLMQQFFPMFIEYAKKQIVVYPDRLVAELMPDINEKMNELEIMAGR